MKTVSRRSFLALALALAAHHPARAVDLDTTGGVTVTAPFNLGQPDPLSAITGAGTLTLDGTGTIGLGEPGPGYTINLNMTGGMIQVSSGATLRNGGWQGGVWTNNLAALNLASGGTLDLWDGNPVRVDALTGSGTVTITPIEIYWAGNRSLTVGVNGGSGVFDGAVLGNGNVDGGSLSVTKAGSGTQTLTGSTTYNGGTTVNGGRLILQNTKTGSSNFVSNADLEFAVTTSFGIEKLNGGTLSGTGNLIKTGIGQMWLGAQGSAQTVAFSGATSVIDVQGGLLRNEYANSAWDTNKAALTVAAGAFFDVWNGNTTLGQLNGAGTINKGWNTNTTLTFGANNGSGSFSGAIFNNRTDFGYGGDPGGNFALRKIGTGTQTLSGTITYAGGTTIDGGRLILLNNKSGSANFTTNADLEFAVTTGIQKLNGGTLNGTGNFVKTGVGQLWFGAPSAPQVIAFTGAGSVIEVQGGLLRNEYGNSTWGANKAGLHVAAGAIFDVWDGNTTVDELSGAGTINKGWSVDTTLTIGANNGSGTFSGAIYNNRTDLGHGGNSGGVFTIVKTGTGTQTLSGLQGYKHLVAQGGVTNVTGSFTGGTATVDANATINFGASQTVAVLNIGPSSVVSLAESAAPVGGIVAVPEPSALLSALSGLALLLGRRRTTKK